MVERYDHILEVVAENPGEPIETITDLAADRSIGDADITDLVTEAVSNGDLLEFDERYWVMRKGKYRFNRYDHSETGGTD